MYSDIYVLSLTEFYISGWISGWFISVSETVCDLFGSEIKSLDWALDISATQSSLIVDFSVLVLKSIAVKIFYQS